jgi:hypothetical protein
MTSLRKRIQQNMPGLSDVVAEANTLHDVLIQTCADELLEATAPILMTSAWELRSKMSIPDADDRTEVFGTMLALRCILAHPKVLQVAAQRLYDRLCELLGEEDQEMIALLKPDRYSSR